MSVFGSMSSDTVLVCSILAHDARYSRCLWVSALINDMLGQSTCEYAVETDFASTEVQEELILYSIRDKEIRAFPRNRVTWTYYLLGKETMIRYERRVQKKRK